MGADNPRPLGDAVDEREHEFVRQQGVSELDYSELLKLAELHARAAGTTPGAPSWRFVGPRNLGGRIVSLGQDPEDPRVIYAGSAQGGLWRSIDAGDTWDRLGDDLVFPVGTIAVAPKAPTTVYFGTGALDPTYVSGRGLFRATINRTTGAANIERLIAPDLPTVPPPNATRGAALRYTRIRVDPDDPKRFWVASQTGLWRCECPITTPAAPVFSLELPTADTTPAKAKLATAVDESPTGTGLWPSHSTDVLVAHDPRETDTFTLENVEVPRYLILFVGVEGAGVYRGRFDRESGTTEFETAPLNIPIVGTFTRIRLAQCERQPQHVFAVLVQGGNATEVFHSANNGDDWTKGSQTMVAAGAGTGQADYDLVLEAAPDDPRIVICGALEICLSTDFGSTWTKILDWTRYDAGDKAQHADQHIAMFDLGDHRKLWVGNDGGLSLARDLRMAPQAFGYWRKRSHGIYAGMCQDVSINPLLPFMCAVGFQDNGSYLSLGGPTWYQVGGGDGGACAFNTTSPRQMFVTWQGPLPPQPPTGEGLELVNAVAFDQPMAPPASFDLVTLAAHDLPETVARGHGVRYRWTDIGLPPSGIPLANPATFVGVVEQHPTVAGSLLLGRQGDGFSSTNFGANWAPLRGTPIAPGRQVTAMAFGHAEANNPVPASVDGWAGTATGTLFITSNAPAGTWAPVPTALPFPVIPLLISEIVVHPVDRRIVAVSATGLQGRVFLTYDQGNSWIDLTEPVPASLAVSPAGASIKVGQTRAFTAMAAYTGGAPIDVTARAVWVSTTANATVVTALGAGGFTLLGYGTEGHVKGVSAGTPTISATLMAGVPTGTASQAVTITVADVPAVTPVPPPRTIVPGSLPPGPVGSIIFDPSVAAAAPMRLLAGTLAGVYALSNIPAIVSVAIQPAGPLAFQTPPPATFQLRCVATLTNGAQIDITKAVDWSITGGGTTTVTNAAPNEGQVTLGGVGSNTVNATRAGVPPATITINVQAAAAPAPAALVPLPAAARPTIDWRLFNVGLPQVLVTDFERVGTTNTIRAGTFGLGVFECVTTGARQQNLLIRQTIIEDGRTARTNPPVIPDDPRLAATVVALDMTHAYDIRVDAPPYTFFDDVVDGVELDEQLEVSDPVPTEDNYVYVQVHNTGLTPVLNALVHLYAAECDVADVINPIGAVATASPASLEAAPIADFYGQPNRNPIGTSKWKRVDVVRTIDKVPSDAPRVVRFTWVPDIALADKNVALLALCEGPPSPPAPASQSALPAAPAGATLSAFILAEPRAALRVVHVAPRPAASLYVRDGVADDTRLGGYPVGGRSPDIMVVHADITGGAAAEAEAFKDHVSRRPADTMSSTAPNFIYVRVHNRRRFETPARVKVFTISLDDSNAPDKNTGSWTELPAGAAFAEVTVPPLGVGYAKVEFPAVNDPNPTGTNKTYLLLALIKSGDDTDPLPIKDRVDSADTFWALVSRFVDSDNAAARAVPWA